METRREHGTIYSSHVFKNRHWSSELTVLKEYLTASTVCFVTREYMRVTEFVTLVFPVARHQAAVNYAGFLLPRQIAFLSETSLVGLRICCHLIPVLRERPLISVRLICSISKRFLTHLVLSALQKHVTRVYYETFVMFDKRRRTNACSRRWNDLNM